MNIEKLIRDFGKNIAKAALNKKESSEQTILDCIGSSDIIKIILNRLVNDGEYNKAENMLFEVIEKDKSQELYNVAVDFYNLLLEKNDEELERGGFSRKEVYQGLKDIKRKYPI